MTDAKLPVDASATITCIIADDHPLVRRGLVATVEDEVDFTVVAEASSAGESTELTRQLRPRLVILDVNMPGSGLDACRRIKAEFSDIHTIMYSFRQDSEIIRASKEAGASSYIVKGTSGPAFISALREVIAGRVIFNVWAPTPQVGNAGSADDGC